MAEKRNALMSVYNKEGIEEFADGLHSLNWNIFASGGTAKAINEAGVPVTDVAELVGGAAILNHKVVTLSREIHAGLLASAQVDMEVEELEKLGIPWLDIVCVDMYPLLEAIEGGLSEQDILTKTDVGGPTMLHSAAKGRRIALSLQEQRGPALEWIRQVDEHGNLPDEENIRRTLAAVAEGQVRDYIGSNADYLGKLSLSQPAQSSYDEFFRQGIELAA